MTIDKTPSLTVRDVARRYRVGEDKVRTWIRRGELKAINTAAVLCGKPRWVITPDALIDFEQKRQVTPPPKPTPRRRRRPGFIDFYPHLSNRPGNGRRGVAHDCNSE